MQATVASYDPATRSGAVLLDDGVVVAFGADAIANSGLRLLRAGQRVRLETAGGGVDLQVVRLQIVTLP